jgi:hypothetical protein
MPAERRVRPDRRRKNFDRHDAHVVAFVAGD